MPRELRPRKARTGHSQLAGAESSSNAGPSRAQIVDEVEDDELARRNIDDDNDNDENDDSGFEMDVDEPLQNRDHTSVIPSKPSSSSSPPKRRKLATTTHPSTSKPLQTITAAPTSPSQVLPARRTTKMYTLPNPSAHHRHRAIPVYHRKEEVERLDRLPALFEEPRTAFTESMTSSQTLTDRVGKAWGYNVGPGPVWEMLEDRSCFKESTRSKDDPRKEASRRPRVYASLSVRPGLEVLDYRCVIHSCVIVAFETG